MFGRQTPPRLSGLNPATAARWKHGPGWRAQRLARGSSCHLYNLAFDVTGGLGSTNPAAVDRLDVAAVKASDSAALRLAGLTAAPRLVGLTAAPRLAVLTAALSLARRRRVV